MRGDRTKGRIRQLAAWKRMLQKIVKEVRADQKAENPELSPEAAADFLGRLFHDIAKADRDIAECEAKLAKWGVAA